MKYTTVTVDNEYQKVSISEKESGEEIPATELAKMFYHVMIALSYHPDLARKMFSDEVDV